MWLCARWKRKLTCFTRADGTIIFNLKNADSLGPMSSGATGGGAARDHPPLIATKDTGTGPSVGMSQKAPPYVVPQLPALPSSPRAR